MAEFKPFSELAIGDVFAGGYGMSVRIKIEECSVGERKANAVLVNAGRGKLVFMESFELVAPVSQGKKIMVV